MLNIDHTRTLRAVRLSVALLITYLFTWYFQVPEGVWATITCCFVLYEYTTLGGVLSKSYLRFLGTILAAIYGGIILYVFGNDPYIDILALIGGVFLNTYLFMDTKKTYSSVLGSVTLVLILLNYHHLGDLDGAVLRPMNILIGEAVSIFTFRYIFPEYARDRVIALQGDIAKNINNMLKTFLNKTLSLEELKNHYILYEKQVAADTTGFNRYIEEAVMEVKKATAVIDEHRQSMVHFARIHHLVSAFYYYRITEKNDAVAEITQSIETIEILVGYLSHIQSVMQDPAKYLDNHSFLNKNHAPFKTVQTLCGGILEELQGLEQAWRNISLIRQNNYKFPKKIKHT